MVIPENHLEVIGETEKTGTEVRFEPVTETLQILNFITIYLLKRYGSYLS